MTRAVIVLIFAFVGCADHSSNLVLPSKENARSTQAASSPPAATAVTSRAAPLSGTAQPIEQKPAAQGKVPTDGTVESAMAGLIDALARRDTQAFLKFVAEERSFRYLATVEKPYRTEFVQYTELVRDLASKEQNGGWYVRLFDAGPDTAFSYFAERSRGRAWKQVEEYKFVPPDASADSSVFVVWRNLRGRWVLRFIGDPEA